MSRAATGPRGEPLLGGAPDGFEKDARRVRIRATMRGERLLHQGRQRRIEYLARHLDGLTFGESWLLLRRQSDCWKESCGPAVGK
jgi:hypothetical protein